MQQVFKMIERVADTDSTILILGESGTGKELVARALHFNSRRQFAPFVPSTAARCRRTCWNRSCSGIAAAPSPAPSTTRKACSRRRTAAPFSSMKSARCRRCCRAGCCACSRSARSGASATTRPIYVNVRVLAATNEPLEKRIKEGTFREDLYYRLNVIPIQLPRLRERQDDIPLLVAHFLKDKTHPHTNRPFQVTRQAMDILCAYDWPGNVRELENAIERAATLCEGQVLQVSDLPPAILAAVAPLTETTEASGNKEAAMAELALPQSALYPLRPAASSETTASAEPEPATFENLEPLKSFLERAGTSPYEPGFAGVRRRQGESGVVAGRQPRNSLPKARRGSVRFKTRHPHARRMAQRGAQRRAVGTADRAKPGATACPAQPAPAHLWLSWYSCPELLVRQNCSRRRTTASISLGRDGFTR